MLPDWDSSIFLDLMSSLDSAFQSRQTWSDHSPDEWGERFFMAFDQEYVDMSEARTAVYMAATEMLYYFAMKNLGHEFGLSLARRPEAFLRSVIMVLRHGRPGTECEPSE